MGINQISAAFQVLKRELINSEVETTDMVVHLRWMEKLLRDRIEEADKLTKLTQELATGASS